VEGGLVKTTLDWNKARNLERRGGMIEVMEKLAFLQLHVEE
jgi:hypothetical protein